MSDVPAADAFRRAVSAAIVPPSPLRPADEAAAPRASRRRALTLAACYRVSSGAVGAIRFPARLLRLNGARIDGLGRGSAGEDAIRATISIMSRNKLAQLP